LELTFVSHGLLDVGPQLLNNMAGVPCNPVLWYIEFKTNQELINDQTQALAQRCPSQDFACLSRLRSAASFVRTGVNTKATNATNEAQLAITTCEGSMIV
jgi:hypothetical protein